jgi:ubiquinone/menaquinone biosynthesis C-methylase UbiE
VSRKTGEDEVERIRSVYDGYVDVAEKKWSRGNRGNQAMTRERHEVLLELLRDHGQWPLTGRKILDVGCGGGELLAFFRANGASDSGLFGVDLLPARIEAAQRLLPSARLSVGNGESLDFPDASFDLVTLFVVFSSILSSQMTRQLAREIARLVRPGGAIVIYEFRVPSPLNRHTRAVRRAEVRRLLPEFELHSRSLTVVPPLARRLGPATGLLYPLFAALPFMRTHNLMLLRRRA